jgi:hypothetical protein
VEGGIEKQQRKEPAMKNAQGALLIIPALVILLSCSLMQSVTAGESRYMKTDETWISIEGKVAETGDDWFDLNYGEGTITVEMDEWDWYDETAHIMEGHSVTVYGMIDEDMYETAAIEAGSVYDEELGVYYYAGSADEQTFGHDYWLPATPNVIGRTIVRGTVSEINDEEFTIDTGARELTIDTDPLPYDPMEEEGTPSIDKGDYVSVSGYMADDFWEARELAAHSLILLINDAEQYSQK